MCDYVAKKGDPETWNQQNSEHWMLDSTSGIGLGIEKWRCPHPSLEGDDRCIFHTEPDGLPEDIDESEALLNALNKAGESPFDDGPEHRGQFIGANFGALNLSGEKIIADEYDIRFDHSEFNSREEEISFENTQFISNNGKIISLNRVSFTTEGEVNVQFDGADFITRSEGAVVFANVSFTTKGKGSVMFSGATFTTEREGAVVFEDASFTTEGNGDVDFGGANFTTEGEGDVWFYDADFIAEGDGDVLFEDSTFTTEGEGDVWFYDADFIAEGDGDVLFEDSIFTTKGIGSLKFRATTFLTGAEGDVSFEDTTFLTGAEGDVRFEDAIFTTEDEGDVKFGDAAFITKNEGNVTFRGTNFIAEGKGYVMFCKRIFDAEDEVKVGGADFITEDVGDVKFRDTTFTTKGRGSVLFRDVSFTTEGEGYLMFGDAAFITEGRGHVKFEDANFTTGDEGNVSFRGATFTTEHNGYIMFDNAVFTTEAKGYIEFLDATFTTSNGGQVDFSGAVFTTKHDEGSIWFGDASFVAKEGGSVNFIDTTFATKSDADVKFKDVSFISEGRGRVNFRRTSFSTEGKGKVVFSDTEFLNSDAGSINFDQTKFGGFGVLSSPSHEMENPRSNYEQRFYKTGTGTVQFDKATFNSETVTEFRGVDFTDDTNFKQIIFDCPVVFDDWFVDTNAFVSFSNAEFIESCQFGSSDGPTEFRGTLDFSEATFHKQVDFEGEVSNTANLGSVAQESSNKFGVTFWGHISFKNAILPEGSDLSNTKFPDETDFSGANLTGVNFRQSDLSKTNLERAKLNRAELLGTNLIGAKLYGVLLGDVRINHQTSFWPKTDLSLKNALLWENPIPGGGFKLWKAWLRQGSIPYCCYDTRYDRIDTLPSYHEMSGFEEGDEKFRLEKAAEVYGTLETAAHDNSLPRIASEAFVGRKDVQRRQYYRDDHQGRQSLLYVRSFVPNMIARYGESPWRVLGFGALTVTGFALLYWTFELIERQGTGSPATIAESMYFSALTFTTLGYGDFRPVNTVGQISAVLETAIGVIMLAILVFVFGRRATR